MYVALCDEEVCEAVGDMLFELFVYIQAGALGTFDTLLSTMRMVFPDGPPQCQNVAVNLLGKLQQSGEPFAGAVKQIVDAMPQAAALGKLR